jgi:Zn-dependent peptidase ImmA (M78 family)
LGPRRRRLIRDQAQALLARFAVSRPPIPITTIAEGLGIDIVKQRYPDSSYSGFYLRKGAKRVIGVNANHSEARQRFTIAHELGHVLLLAHDDLHVDGTFRLRDATSSQGTDRHEVEANFFAAELLMPETMLHDAVRRRGGIDPDDERQIKELAKLFGVSTHALLIRLSTLGYVLSAAPIT